MGIDIDFNDLLSESDERIDCSDFPVAWMVYTEDGKSVYVTDNPEDIKPGQRALPLFTRPDTRTCTCHPDDNPPVPCARRYALSECRKTAPPAPQAEPERVPLTDDFVYRVVRSEQPDLSEDSKAWKELFAECRYWLNAAHGITGDAK